MDLRKDSSTCGKWESVILSSENKKQLFIPKGFARGFLVLSKESKVLYKVDNPYSYDHDSGIHFKTQGLNINWTLPLNDIKISSKDHNLTKVLP